MWDELVRYAARDSINLSGISDREKEALRLRLKALLARYRWRNTGFYQVLNSADAVVQKAIETIK
jgi:carboxyl-terminal processing protease